jgi:predicted nucleic acid-binding Zn ribbon protein
MRFPKTLTTVLADTLKSYNLNDEVKRYDALTNWETIVGEKVAAVATPERIKGSSLIVRVTSSVWRYELTMRSAEILRKIHSYTGSNELKEIVWR